MKNQRPCNVKNSKLQKPKQETKKEKEKYAFIEKEEPCPNNK